MKSGESVQEFLHRNFKCKQMNESILPSVHYDNLCSAAQQPNCKLPLIQASFGQTNLNLLVDSGASISILPREIFDSIKSNVTVKYLSRQVEINTINSAISFSACAEISFKIDKSFFKHHFFICNYMSSNFHGILGFDFMNKYSLNIDTKNGQFNFNNFSVPFKSTVQFNDSNDNEVIAHAFLQKKLTIEPNESVLVNAYVKDSALFQSEDSLFTPCIQNEQLSLQESFVSLRDNVFSLLIYNDSNVTFHLNKNTKLGYVSNNFSIVDNETIDSTELINHVIPSQEVLNLRKQQLSPDDFQLEHLSSEQKDQMLNILMNNFAAFSKNIETLGATDRVKPNVTLKNNLPIKTLPYDIPHALQDFVRDELNNLMAAGIIERNCSNYACPLLLVKKKQDPSKPNDKPQFRLALDLRLLNAIIEHSTYPLPKISTIINNISKFKFYTKLDLRHAYWQILLPDELKDILTFTTPFGSFANKRLPFGLKTSASTFQALIDSIIDDLYTQGIFDVFAYQDDFVLCADSFEDMSSKLKSVLSTLSENNITLTPSKCVFFTDNIEYLGFHISQNTIRPISANIAKITRFTPPKTVRQVRRFLGLCGFYRNLIPNFAHITSIINELTHKNKKFVWTDEHQQAFEKLQNMFFTEPFVTLPDFSKPFYVNTDASKKGISAILMQEHEGQLKPVSYFSKGLTKGEKNYPALKLELFAIYKGVIAFKQYLYNRKFTIISDSKPLKFYKKSSSPADLITRWLLELSEYSYDFHHIAGSRNLLADYCSRAPNPDIRDPVNIQDNSDHDDSLILPFIEDIDTENVNVLMSQDPKFQITVETFKNEQKKDKTLVEIIDYLATPSLDKLKKFQNFFISPINGLLMFQKSLSDSYTDLIVVPDNLKSKVLQICHVSHTGIKKTYELVSTRFFWKGIYSDTVNYVLSCDLCIKNKPFSVKPAPLKSMYLPHRPGEFVSMDIVGPVKESGHILTVIDHFSKFVVLYPLHNLTTNTITKHLLNYISLFGRMSFLLCDLGTQFNSQVFHAINNELGIKIAHTTSGHPACNAVSERINTSIKSSLITLREQGMSLESALLIHQNVYNSTIHSSTGYSPFLLHFGREVSIFFDVYSHDLHEIPVDHASYITQVLGDLNIYYQNAYSSLERNQLDQNNKFATKAKLRSFEVNDIVYLRSKDTFNPRYTGPFTIVTKNNDVNYTIRLLSDSNAPSFKIHVNRIKGAPARKQSLLSTNDPPLPAQETRYYLRSRN